MNNKGFSLNELLIGLGVIAFALILSTLLFQSKFKEVDAILKNGNEDSKEEKLVTYTYEDMELELVKAATQYIESKVESGSTLKSTIQINMDTLIEEGLYTSIYDPNDTDRECEGYVLYKKQKSTISYTPHLKCGSNYETQNK